MYRENFTILNEKVHNKPLVYLDNAATTQKPEAVIEAISYAYRHYNANIHRGVHHLSQVMTMAHENARRKVAAFIGAESAEEIVFTKGTTNSINMLAWSLGEWKKDGEYVLQPGDEIVVSAVEHHSNIVPWQMLAERRGLTLRVIPLKDDETLDIAAYTTILNERTKLVSCAWVSNVLGIINPIEEIGRLAHEAGALFAIDAAQGAPHLPTDVKQLGADFLSFSVHKMYGPTGIGVLFGRSELLNQLPPAEGGGEMIEHVSWEKTTYNTLPYKFEAGTPDFIGSYATATAIDYIAEKGGMATLSAYEEELTNRLENALLQGYYSGCTIRIYAKSVRKAGAVSFNLYSPQGKLIHPYDVGMLLDQQGVAVRTGHHCAEPLIDRLGVPGTVRASIAFYNDMSDIEALIKALERAAAMLG